MTAVRRWQVVLSTRGTPTLVWEELYDGQLAYLDPHVEPSPTGVTVTVYVVERTAESAEQFAVSAVQRALVGRDVQVERISDAGPTV